MSASPVTLDFSKARPITSSPISVPAQPSSLPQSHPQTESIRDKLISLGGRFLGMIDPFAKTGPLYQAGQNIESRVAQSQPIRDIKQNVAQAEAHPQQFYGEKIAPLVIGAVGPGEFGAGAELPHIMPELGEGAANESGKAALQELGKKYKVTDINKDILTNPSFIASNGQVIDLGDTWHPAALQNLSDEVSRPYKNLSTQEDAREKFLNDSNAIRLRPRMDRSGQTLHATVPKNGISEAQADTLRQAVGQMRYGNLLIETADAPSISRSEYKEFARPSDVDNMLKRIGAHPSQKATRVSQKIGSLEGAILVKSRENPEIVEGANRYQTAHGNPPVQPTKSIPLDQDLAKATADYFEKTPHNPNSPEVQKSYNSLKQDISDQWNHATKDMGITFEPWSNEGQPYKNSAEMMEDVRNNHHLYFYQGGDIPKDHPLAEISPQTGLSYNDMFRAVHDLFGHAAEGNEFGPTGERRAFVAHSQMMQPESVPALAFETHGQNSWVNFGQHLRNESGNIPVKGEEGFIPQAERPFAEQKANVMPAELHRAQFENLSERLKTENTGAINPTTGKTDTTGIGTEVYPEAKVRLNHKPTTQDIQNFYNQNKELFDKHPELRLGWDKDPTKGWELNIGASGPNAIEVAKKLDQRAAFDIEKGEEIPTGGKNVQKDFPNYTLEQRLAELKGETPKTPKGSTVPLLENPIPTETGGAKPLFPESLHKGITIENPNLADFQKSMGDWMQKTAGDINKPSAILQRSVRLAHNEINHWIMENGGEGRGWYRKKTGAAINALTKLHPELSNPAHATIFKALWAAHSYGNEPFINIDEAEQNLTNLEKTGQVAFRKNAEKKWSGHSGNVYTLAKTQHLIDKYGEDGAAKWLTTKHPWSEIQTEFQKAGLSVSKKSITLDDNGDAYGAMAFGPKGGAFFLNLNGINDHTTVDVWGTRALRRWEGRIGDPETLTKDYDSGLTVDMPPSSKEIERYRNVIGDVAKKLGLDTDDVQALQWYYEHKLYEVHGVGEAARDYEEAANHVIRQREEERNTNSGEQSTVQSGRNVVPNRKIEGKKSNSATARLLGFNQRSGSK